MKVGITLPQFRDDAEPAVATARAAEAAGLDGVFVFDHLWPIGRPDRPALHSLTLAGALAVETERVAVGTLVARVGLLPDAVLLHSLAALHRIAGDRLIAGLGIGDHLSRVENQAYGVPFRPRAERLAALVDVCRRLRARGITTWVGGTSPETWAVAAPETDALNLWGVDTERLVAAAGAGVPVTWAGQVDLSASGATGVASLLRSIADTGATWAVVAPVRAAWPEAVDTVGAAMGALVD